MRQPMCTALFTIGVGLGMLSSSWHFTLPFLAIVVVIVFRVRKEDEGLIEKFGESYLKYSQGTG